MKSYKMILLILLIIGSCKTTQKVVKDNRSYFWFKETTSSDQPVYIMIIFYKKNKSTQIIIIGNDYDYVLMQNNSDFKEELSKSEFYMRISSFSKSYYHYTKANGHCYVNLIKKDKNDIIIRCDVLTMKDRITFNFKGIYLKKEAKNHKRIYSKLSNI